MKKLALEDQGFTHSNHIGPAEPTPEEQTILEAQLRQLAAWKASGNNAFFGLPFVKGEMKKALTWAKRIRKRAKQLVVFGIGGSSLGAEMLLDVLGKGDFPVMLNDNVDPETLAHNLEGIDWRETFLLVVSKSGGTAETLSQLLTTLPAMEKQLGRKGLRKQMAAITENPDGALGLIAHDLKIPIIVHPHVGGRFSVLSVVGLLPGAVAGANIKQLLKGAAAMAQRCMEPELADNPAMQMSLAQHRMAQKSRNISVQMAYGDRLCKIPQWYAQLWAESLGKQTENGEARGLTPVAARGVTDQHSQLQLYAEGPADKQFTFLHHDGLGSQGMTIPPRYSEIPAVKPLSGRTTGQLFEAEFKGTRDALIHSNAPVRTFHLQPGNAYALGELIILLETETAITGALMKIDPFDQPGVEDSKVRARQYLAEM
ncbi:MAG: glucose-6-phosphate isomerase [Magnetococcales bacterium]|nr:glucose-6-phosphate isomerase [Magnetococcales bacterium]